MMTRERGRGKSDHPRGGRAAPPPSLGHARCKSGGSSGGSQSGNTSNQARALHYALSCLASSPLVLAVVKQVLRVL